MSEIKWSDPTYFTDKHALSMTLRDYFAAKALQGMLSSDKIQTVLGKEIKPKEVASACYEWADLLLEARINQGEKA